MPNRGRPRTEDVLTPREYEVLALLREGVSNREIAEKLGISLAGAKFHVSEIISKLGVDSREEAAAWDGRSRRWGFIPMLGLPSWASGVSGLLTPKAAAAGLAAAVATPGLTAGAVLVGGSDSDDVPLAAAQPTATATPELELPSICEQVACFSRQSIRTDLASLEEALALATFPIRLPGYVPAGFEQLRLTHERPGPRVSQRPDGSVEETPFASDPYYDQLWIGYENLEGELLTVKQGYYHVAPTGWFDAAPEGMKGTLDVLGKEVRWVRGGPKPTTAWELNEHGGASPVDAGWDDGGYMLFWSAGSQEIDDAWEILPGGERRSVVRPLEFYVGSPTLPLSELVKVAESLLR